MAPRSKGPSLEQKLRALQIQLKQGLLSQPQYETLSRELMQGDDCEALWQQVRTHKRTASLVLVCTGRSDAKIFLMQTLFAAHSSRSELSCNLPAVFYELWGMTINQSIICFYSLTKLVGMAHASTDGGSSG